MGGPELPSDPGHEMFPTPAVDHPRVGAESEDSDDQDAYEGYQPLSMDDGATVEPLREREQLPADEDDDGDIDLMNAPVTHGDPNMPPIVEADVEIERQVWNEPRPKELQIELDKARTEQILKAMSTITLPNITVPAWAQGVPEERWKLELLERINNRQRPPGQEPPSTEKPHHSKSPRD
ncbi:hypothetical protein KR009_008740 [Drosophila setifemur]|nr:hypothetical protein KR009_008740 [Drosophila setifemur]